ncbi:MAG: transcription elongation factor GreA [Burkholderiaceae bacterium]|jgi:hypothetical protein|nr:transcription elongation factor GreA [Burkholderiaceae bacterium]
MASVSPRLASYVNVPLVVAIAIANKKATLIELQTVYGIEDLYDMMEMIAVESYNRGVMAEEARDYGDRY